MAEAEGRLVDVEDEEYTVCDGLEARTIRSDPESHRTEEDAAEILIGVRREESDRNYKEEETNPKRLEWRSNWDNSVRDHMTAKDNDGRDAR